MRKIVLWGVPILFTCSLIAFVAWEYVSAQNHAQNKYAFQESALKGYTLYSKGDMQGAKQAYDEAYAIYPNDAMTLQDMGNVYATFGKTKEATHFFHEAYRLDNDKYEALYKATLGELMLGNTTQAIQMITTLIHKDTKRTKYTRVMALALEKEGKMDEALAYYAYTIKNKKYLSDTKLEALKQAYELKPLAPVEIVFEYETTENIEELVALMQRYKKEGYDTKALRSAQKILLQEPEHILALRMAGDLMKEHGSNQEALAYLTQIEPKDAYVHESIGAVYHRIREYAKALEYYELALEEKPNEELVRAACSVSFYLKDTQRIEQYFNQLEKLNPLMAHNLLYAMEADSGKKHTVREKVQHIALGYWYGMLSALKNNG